MLPTHITAILEQSVSDRRLLEHPFYRRWEAGQLDPSELTAYAAQYRHFEAALPRVLAEVAGRLEPGPARRQVEANLDDELGAPAPHLELFDLFAEAVQADRAAAPSPAMAALVQLHEELAAADVVAALAAVAAYEIQAPAIAYSKAEGLRTRYGLSAAQTEFWDVHATMDADHASWTAEALAELGASEGVVRLGARSAAEAWWAFLDEREEAAAELAAC